MQILTQFEAGSRVRKLREARGLTVADVAGHLGIDADELDAIEDGSEPMTGGDSARLASLFDVPVSQLTEKSPALLFRADQPQNDATRNAVNTAFKYIDFHRGVRALSS